MDKVKKNLKIGFVLSIIQVGIFIAAAVVVATVALEELFVSVIVVSVMAVIVLILSLLARKGKKGAALAIIIISCFVWSFAILSIIGGVFMYKALEAFANDAGNRSAAGNTVQATATEMRVADKSVKTAEKQKRRGISAWLAGVKGKFVREERGSTIKTFITLSVFYAVVLMFALISYFTYFFKVFDGSTECRAVCSMFIALTPAYFVYFGAHNPFNFKKAIAVLLIIAGVAGFVGCDVLLIMSTFDCVEASMDGGVIMFFAFCVIIAQIAITLGFMYICKDLPYGWYIGLGIGGSVILPLLAALIIAVIVIVTIINIAIIIIRFLGSMFAQSDFGKGFLRGYRGEAAEQKKYTFTNSMGSTQTVYSTDGKNFYDADGSYVGSSDDGGKTIHS